MDLRFENASNQLENISLYHFKTFLFVQQKARRFSQKTKRQISLANRCYYYQNGQLSSISCTTKLLIIPVLLFIGEQ